jgi:predicted unusual protein kinase regulating ubiquinone biosynthesis (AarF/ABC1/UbiB family)
MAAAGAGQALRGQPVKFADLLSSPSNALKVANKLATMRGAAMKLGQMLSMDAGKLLPPEWSPILSRLQADAAPMPTHQVEAQLTRFWGQDWRQQFETFSDRPIAAASIGQVHKARTLDGRELAIKVQYPGVAASIDSDLDNLVAVIRASRLVPPELNMDAIVGEARQQLHEEADYLREAAQIKRYQAWVAADDTLLVPDVDESLTREGVLAMTFVESQPIEQVVAFGQQARNKIVERLVRLVLQEIFEFGLVQTDPNFANFRYQPSTKRIVLLDFGATRSVSVDLAGRLQALLKAALNDNQNAQRAAMLDIGYFRPEQERLSAFALDLLRMVMDAIDKNEEFDFEEANLPARARDKALALGFSPDLWSIPPAETLFIHRKIGGMYLLASRLQAKVRVRELLESYASLPVQSAPPVRGT